MKSGEDFSLHQSNRITPELLVSCYVTACVSSWSLALRGFFAVFVVFAVFVLFAMGAVTISAFVNGVEPTHPRRRAWRRESGGIAVPGMLAVRPAAAR